MTMRNYSADELLELSKWEPTDDVALGLSGDVTGVVMPRDYTAGQLMHTDHARTLAAQLLREADLHDAIYDSGYQAGQQSLQPQVDMLLRTLQYVRHNVSAHVGPDTKAWRSMTKQMEEALGIFKDEDEDDTQPPIGGPGS